MYEIQLNKCLLNACHATWHLEEQDCWDFPGGPMVEIHPSNAGDAGSIPGWGTKIAQATEQLSLHTATSEPTYHN